MKFFFGRSICGLAIFCVSQELIFAIKTLLRTDWFFLLGINFCDFQNVPDKPLMILSFLSSTCNGNTYFQQYYGARPLCKTSTRFDYSSICGARKRQVPIEQTRLAKLEKDLN